MIRFAVVGATLAPVLARVRSRLDGGELVALVDVDGDLARREAKNLGIGLVADNAQELHERHDGQFDAWIAAAPRGLIVAPHDNRPLDTQRSRWGDLPTGWLWGHRHRFLPSINVVLESAASGKLGEAGLVRIHDWRHAADDDFEFVLAGQLDLACELAGREPMIVSAVAAGEKGARGCVLAQLAFPNDATALVDCVRLPAGAPDYYSLSVIGATGAAYADDHHNVQLQLAADGARAVKTSEGDLAVLAAISEYLAAAAADRPPACGGREWRRASALVEAALRSLDLRRPVRLGVDVP